MLVFLFWLTFLTFVPGLELRASIPFGFFGNNSQPVFHLALVFLVCITANIILGMLVFELMGPVVAFFRRWGWFERRIWPMLERTRHKLKPWIDKYGTMGVAIFIGVPLPGSGVYTGAFGSYLLGLKRRNYAIANVLGVLMAGILVMALCFLLRLGAVGEDSLLARIIIKETRPVITTETPLE